MTMASNHFRSSIIVIFISMTILTFSGCATTEDLGRSYGVLNERLDATEKRLAALIGQKTDMIRQESQTEDDKLGKELRDFRVHTLEDIEINRRAIRAAATTADLKRLEDKTGRLFDNLEAKTSASLDGKIQSVNNDIVTLGKNLEEILGRLEKLSSEMSSDLRKSKTALDADIGKAKAELEYLRGAIETETANNKAEVQLTALESKKIRTDLEFAKDEIERVKQELNSLLNETEASKSALAESRARIEKGEIEITKVSISGPDGESGHVFQSGDDIKVHMVVTAKAAITDFVFGLGLFNADGVCVYGTNTNLEEFQPSAIDASTPYIARNARPTVRLPFHLISKALIRSPALTTRSTSDCARERQK